MERKIRLVNIITGLNTGGAEIALCKLLENINREKFECSVISLMSGGSLEDRVKKAGSEVRGLGMKRGRPSLKAFLKIIGLLREIKPDVVQTWMYHANLIGGAAGRILGIPIVWNITHSNLDPKVNKTSTLLVVKLCALLSRVIPVKIVTCAAKALDVHACAGYDAERMLVIPNGFDTNVFCPDAAAGLSFRGELNLPADVLLVGVVARFDHQKDHGNFFKAAGELLKRRDDIWFVLCGDGMTPDNSGLAAMMEDKVRSRSFLLGRRSDVPRVMAGLDVFVLPSAGEAFPNVVGEAMSCGVPCVVTDVGDASLIVGGAGIVVPPGDCAALAGGVERMFAMTGDERACLGEMGRRRIVERYEIGVVTRMYENLYETCAERG